MSCLPPSRLSSLQQAILLPLKGQLLSHAEPHVGDFRLNKAPLVLPLRSPPHSSPNTELPAASQGLAPRTEGEGTAGQGLRHSLLGWEVGSQPGIASRKTQTELEFQGQGRQKAEAEWPEGGGGQRSLLTGPPAGAPGTRPEEAPEPTSWVSPDGSAPCQLSQSPSPHSRPLWVSAAPCFQGALATPPWPTSHTLPWPPTPPPLSGNVV